MNAGVETMPGYLSKCSMAHFSRIHPGHAGAARIPFQRLHGPLFQSPSWSFRCCPTCFWIRKESKGQEAEADPFIF